jgi:tetratricopeptide (TPR) repeat protein
MNINTLQQKSFVWLSILLISFLLYGVTIPFDFNLDDNYILENISGNDLNLGAFEENFDRVDYRPLPVISFNIQNFLQGEVNAKTSHFINVILYIIGIFSLYSLLILLMKDSPNKHLFAFCAVMLFAAHPIHSNVVSSIKNRDVLMSFFFAILGFKSFVKYTYYRKKKQLVFCFIFSVCALISKLDAIWIIMMLPIYYFLSNGKINFKHLLNTLKFVLFSFLIFLYRYFMATDANPAVDINPILFTENPMIGSGIAGLIFYPIISFFYYLKFLIIPFGYYFYFGFQTIPTVHFLHHYFIMGGVLFLMYVYSLFHFYRKDKLIFLYLIFFGTAILFFVNLIKPLAAVVAPRLIYHASAPFCVLVVFGIYHLAKSKFMHDVMVPFNNFKTIESKTLLLTFLLILFYIPFTITRNLDWKNHITLMDADLPNLKDSFQANRIGSATYLRMAEDPANFKTNEERLAIVRKGLTASKNAAKIDPNSLFTQEGIGIAERILGNNKKALDQFKLVIEKFDTSEVAWDFSGDILLEAKNYSAAVYHYKNAIRVNPFNNETYQKLNHVAITQQLTQEVLPFYNQMTLDNPNWYVPHEQMAYLYLMTQDSLNAALYFKNTFERGKKDVKTYNLLSDFLLRNQYEQEYLVFTKAYEKPLSFK